MSTNKVFFHGAGQGIGSMMLELNQAGIPFAIKSINNVGFAVEGANLSKQYDISNQIVLRFTNPGGGGETPDYKLLPYVSAEYWANKVLDSLAKSPEIFPYKEYIWIEAMNELRTKPEPGEVMGGGLHPIKWLGMFALKFATIMNSHGYKVLAFGMNGGTPEPEDWTMDGMSAYLAYCSNHPGLAGVSLHEYNWGMATVPASVYPYHLGRFTYLLDACSRLKLSPPQIFISEWGWAYDNMPDQDLAMSHWEWYASLLAQYPAVKAAYAWNLEGNVPSLSSKMQQMIPLITDYTKRTIFQEPGEPQVPDIKPAKIKHTIHLLPQDTTRNELSEISLMLHPTKTAFTYSHDVAHAVLYAGNNDSKVVIWFPERWNEDIVGYFKSRGFKVEIGGNPDSPTVKYVDMWEYFVPSNGDYGPIVILRNNWGDNEERVQLQAHGGFAYITKNSNYEKYSVDPNFVTRVLDTSPGGNEYYTVEGPMMPKIWGVGSLYVQNNRIKFYNLETCQKTADYHATSTLHFVKIHDDRVIGGIQFVGVAEIHWLVDGNIIEKYWYVKHVGLVEWENNRGMHSWAVNYHPVGTQHNNELGRWPCL